MPINNTMFNTTNCGMMMLDIMDPESMVCVNPYELESPPVRQNPTNYKHIDGMMLFAKSQQSRKLGSIKNDMEEFKDLSSFVLSSGQQLNVVDELNTPIFTKDAFDFMPTDNNKTNTQQQQHLEETTTTTTSITEFDDLPIFKEINNFNYDVSEQTSPVSSVTSDATTYSNNQRSAELLLLSPETADYNLHNNAYFDINQCTTTTTTTMDHRQMTNNREPLKLSFNLTDANMTSLMAGHDGGNDVIINTPDVIDDVVDLENVHDFNILDLVKMEDIRLLECNENFHIFDNIKVEPSDSHSNESIRVQDGEESSSLLSYCQSNQPQQQDVDSCQNSDDYDDNDTEYFPPGHVTQLKRRRRNSSIKLHKTIIDSDVDVDDDDVSDEEDHHHHHYYGKQRKRRRGRPPKNQQQMNNVSSILTPPLPSGTKYRELRDKNNEASRRSRLKRKLKELDYEREAEEMELRNVKLKTQVEQLEKMVENFRSNLFKIMMKK